MADDVRNEVYGGLGRQAEGLLEWEYGQTQHRARQSEMSQGTILDHTVRRIRIFSGNDGLVADVEKSALNSVEGGGYELIIPMFDAEGMKSDSYAVLAIDANGRVTPKDTDGVVDGVISGEMWHAQTPGGTVPPAELTARLGNYAALITEKGIEHGRPYMSSSLEVRPMTTRQAIDQYSPTVMAQFPGATPQDIINYCYAQAFADNYRISDLTPTPTPTPTP